MIVMIPSDPLNRWLYLQRVALLSWVDAYKDRGKIYYPNRGEDDATIIVDEKKKMSVDWYNSVDIASFIKKLKKMLGV